MGIRVVRSASSIFVSHQNYVIEIIEWVKMLNDNPSQTLVESSTC